METDDVRAAIMTLRMTFSKRRVSLLLLSLLLLALGPPPALAQEPSAPGGNQDWPRQFPSGSLTFTVHQPQLDGWHGGFDSFHGFGGGGFGGGLFGGGDRFGGGS